MFAPQEAGRGARASFQEQQSGAGPIQNKYTLRTLLRVFDKYKMCTYTGHLTQGACPDPSASEADEPCG